jgi:hypothetical protein
MGPELLNRADASIVAKFYSHQSRSFSHKKKQKQEEVLLPAENFKGLRFILSLPAKGPSSLPFSGSNAPGTDEWLSILKSGLDIPGDFAALVGRCFAALVARCFAAFVGRCFQDFATLNCQTLSN